MKEISLNYDIQNEATKVVKQYAIREIAHGALCGCPHCMGKARQFVDFWSKPQQELDMQQKDEIIMTMGKQYQLAKESNR